MEYANTEKVVWDCGEEIPVVDRKSLRLIADAFLDISDGHIFSLELGRARDDAIPLKEASAPQDVRRMLSEQSLRELEADDWVALVIDGRAVAACDAWRH